MDALNVLPRRPLIAAILALAMASLLTLVSVRTVAADSAEPASCVGHEASGISPPGSSEEFPGGPPELKAAVEAAFPGVPLGQVVRIVATQHLGSHEACDEALG
jgi:hypothetical protein